MMIACSPTRGAGTWYGEANQNGAYSLLARATSLDGTGQQCNVWEGNCLTQADVNAIVAHVYDLGTDKTAPSGTPVLPNPTVSVAANIFNTLQTIGWPVQVDYFGWNFRLDLQGLYAANANHWYLIEVELTLTNGQIVWLRFIVKAVSIQSAP